MKLLTRDADGKITGAKMTAIDMSQPGSAVRIDRLDIQRAQSAALVTVGGVEYAIVSDDNHNFNDPYYKAMFEAPNFLWTPSGPPIPYGGSVSAKKVAVGGKLGIVQDPFGTPVYLGATTPLDGYGILNLSVSPDNKVLIGQMFGYTSTLDPNHSQPGKNVAWDVTALIQAAVANQANGMTNHIVLPPNALQQMPVVSQYPAGAFFDGPLPVNVNVTGNMGDVIKVDLAQTIAMQKLNLTGTFDGLPPNQKAKVKDLEAKLTFTIDPIDVSTLKNGSLLKLAVNPDGTPISGDGGFATSGVLYFVPNITAEDEKILRAGGVLDAKFTDFSFSYLDNSTPEDAKKGSINGSASVEATDYAKGSAVFVGDRPLNDPGYSKFTLTGDVKVGSTNTLDVYRVEQRLAYLGYSAFGMDSGKPLVNNVHVPKEIVVDGNFGAEAQSALKALYAETHYLYYSGSGSNGIQTVTPTEATVAKGSDNFAWLNAYNAPHWMNIYSSFNIPTNNTSNSYFTDGQRRKEVYATSWVHDLLSAWTVSKDAQGLTTGLLRMNGMSDPTERNVPHSHGVGGHSVGMSIDLGVRAYINPANQLYTGATAPSGFVPRHTTVNGWSLANAQTGAGELVNAQGNRQSDALLNFLSIYALTRTDGSSTNGTWTGVGAQLVNNDATNTELQALFGSGTNDKYQLIQNVWIGGNSKLIITQDGVTGYQNPYVGINAVLGQLGFSGVKNDLTLHHAPLDPHYNHFHIDLRPPKILQLPQNLLADSATPNQVAPVASDALVANAQSQLDQVKSDLNLTQGEVTMFIPDMPNVPPQDAPVMIAQANQAQAGGATGIRAVGVCAPASNNIANLASSGDNVFIPLKSAQDYFNLFEHRTTTGIGTTTIVQQPAHGVLRLITQADVGTILPSGGDPVDPAAALYIYLPDSNYVGKDSATVQVDFGNGLKVNVKYYFQVISGGVPDDSGLCSKTRSFWKISSTLDANGNSVLTVVDYLPSINNGTSVTGVTLASVLGKGLASSLDANTSGTSILLSTGITLNIADLPGGAVGQTTGTSITLDTNAAGYGWYVDPNPAANTDFLPTSNPDVWMAKAGSAAAGKMDMLSVLLHEYGHALGLDHSANPNDFMAPDLQPGERRLPSSAELAQLSQLVAQLQPNNATASGLVGWASAQQVGMNSDLPGNLPVPFPTLPLGGMSLAFAGLLRGSRYGGLSIDFASSVMPLHSTPQYAVAANAAFITLDRAASLPLSAGTSLAVTRDEYAC
jgi:hypothetical protein